MRMPAALPREWPRRLMQTVRRVRDKARCSRASIEGIDKASQRTKLGARGRLLRGSTKANRRIKRGAKVSVEGVDKGSQR